RIVPTRLRASVSRDGARRRRRFAGALLNHRGENFAPDVAAHTLPFPHFLRCEPADVFALRSARRDPLLSPVEFDSGPALRPDGGRRGSPPTYPDHLPPLALVGRAGGKVRRENSTGGGSTDRRCGLCPVPASRRWWHLLDHFFSSYRS